MLNGDFKPATGSRCLEKVNRTQLPDIVIYLKEVIKIDWAEVNFIIGTNPDEFIEIKFERSPDADIGLKAYMNTLISQNETISQFNLKRVLNYWDHKDEKYIYFMLMPPWIKQKVAEAYEQVLLKESLKKREGEEEEESKEASRIRERAKREERKGADKKKLKLYSAEIDLKS